MTGAAEDVCEGLTGPIDRAGRACGDGLGVLKHLELRNMLTMVNARHAATRENAIAVYRTPRTYHTPVCTMSYVCPESPKP